MAFLTGRRILPPDLDGLIRFTGQETCPRHIKSRSIDTSLTIKGPWLDNGLCFLKIVAGMVIPEVQTTIICSRYLLEREEQHDDGYYNGTKREGGVA